MNKMRKSTILITKTSEERDDKIKFYLRIFHYSVFKNKPHDSSNVLKNRLHTYVDGRRFSTNSYILYVSLINILS